MSNVTIEVANTDNDIHLNGLFDLHPMAEGFDEVSDENVVAIQDGKVVAIATIKGKRVSVYSHVDDDLIKAKLEEFVAMHVTLYPSATELLRACRDNPKAAHLLHRMLNKFMWKCRLAFTKHGDSNWGCASSREVREALPYCEARTVNELLAWTAAKVRESCQRGRREAMAQRRAERKAMTA
jgi:hypothetical protein